MTVRTNGRCADCGRWVLEDGPMRRVEAAWDVNGRAAAVLWLESLETGRLRRRYVSLLADLAIRLEDFCQTGTLRVPEQLNRLTPLIWEIKAGTLRLLFFHVPNTTTGSVRATHGFIKNSQKTPQPEIRRAEAIRREDLKR